MMLQVPSVSDKERLLETVSQALSSCATYAPHLISFRRQLQRARTVWARGLHDDLITMHSPFAIRHDRTGETVSYTLADPEGTAVENHGDRSDARSSPVFRPRERNDDAIRTPRPTITRQFCPSWFDLRIWEDDGGQAQSN